MIGLGVPAWGVSVLMDGNVELTSVLIQLIPLAIRLYAMMVAAEIPKYSATSATLAWLLFGVPFVLAWQFCDPAAMINLSHWNRVPVPDLIPNTWLSYAIVLVWVARS